MAVTAAGEQPSTERQEQLVLWAVVAASTEGVQLAEGDDGEEWT